MTKPTKKTEERNREAFQAEALECCPTWEWGQFMSEQPLEMVEIILEAKGKYLKPFLETSLYTIYNCKASVAELYTATISQYNKNQ